MRVVGTRQDRIRLGILKLSLFSVLATTGVACTADQELIPLVVHVLGGRSMSKLPFMIAEDQGLYEKHGLDVELWLEPPGF